MPAMGDERFARAVIYVCAHSTEGAMGIIVNQPAANIKFPDLLVQLEVIPAAERIQLPSTRRSGEGAQGRAGRDRPRLCAAFGRLLHREFDAADRRGHLPHRDARHPQGDRARQRARPSAILALGYAGWAPGQLENEIQQNGWLHCAADPELIFGTDTDAQIRKGAAQDRHRPRHAVERGRPRLSVIPMRLQRGVCQPRCRAAGRAPPPRVIGSPKAKPCAYSQPSW